MLHLNTEFIGRRFTSRSLRRTRKRQRQVFQAMLSSSCQEAGEVPRSPGRERQERVIPRGWRLLDDQVNRSKLARRSVNVVEPLYKAPVESVPPVEERHRREREMRL
jgi:hypothetical protein